MSARIGESKRPGSMRHREKQGCLSVLGAGVAALAMLLIWRGRNR